MAIRGPDIILYEKIPQKHVAIIRINREERANTITFDLMDRLGECWSDAKFDDDIWAVIFTAVGDRYFCAGDDLKHRVELEKTYPGGYTAALADVVKKGSLSKMQPREFWKPIIGAINGYALAGGWWLAQMCDVRIAAEHALFGIPEVRWNLRAPFTAQACRMIPMGIALEITLWGNRQYTAQRMYEVGFVNKVISKEQLMDEAMRWAEEVCEMGPKSVWLHKQLMYRATFYDDPIVNDLGTAIFAPLYAMEDSIEGPQAFVERRKPVWKLR